MGRRGALAPIEGFAWHFHLRIFRQSAGWSRSYESATSGVHAVSVWHVLSSGQTALETFNRFQTAFDANQLAYTTSDIRLTRIDVTRLDNSSATETFDTTGVKFDGAQAGDLVPALCLLVKYTTGFRGLASIGHTYAPFVAEAVQTNGHFDAVSLPTLQTAWASFVNTLSTQTIPLQVVSLGREAGGPLPAAPATNHTVTGVSVSSILATQRNRQSRLRS